MAEYTEPIIVQIVNGANSILSGGVSPIGSKSSGGNFGSGIVGQMKSELSSLKKQIDNSNSREEIKNLVNKSAGISKEISKLTSGSGMLGGLGKLTGVIGAVMEIASLVREAVDGLIKPIKGVLLGILKLAAQLLRPFADMIMILLIPILQTLKPLIRVFNETMMPYRKIAYQMMSAATKQTTAAGAGSLLTGGIAVLLTGFQMGIWAIIKDVFKMLINNIIDTANALVLQPLINLVQMLADNIMNAIRPIVDKVTFGLATDAFDAAKEKMDSGFNDFKVLINATAETAKTTISTGIDSSFNALKNSALKSANDMLKALAPQVDFKTPEDQLAAGISRMVSNAVARSSGGNSNNSNPFSGISKTGTTTMSENQYLDLTKGMTAGDILSNLRNQYGITDLKNNTTVKK